MRRWKKIALGTLALLVLCGVLGYVFRYTLGNALIAVTLGEFDPDKAPPAPDYAQESSWASLPTKEDAADRVPEGFEESASTTQDKVNVFYIHPTGYNGLSNWNATVGNEMNFAIPTSVMLAGQASVFNKVGEVYAPEYRQACLMAFFAPTIAPERKDGYKALELAYSDVARAFDYFIEHYSEGKPFIIASHSQGSGHALRLLAEKVDKTPLFEKLIAAYVVGCSMPEDFFTRVYENIKPCTSPEQLGTLITWNTMGENARLPLSGFHWYPDGWEYLGDKKMYSVNPLTWNTSEERADASLHKGALRMEMVSQDVDPDAAQFNGISDNHTWAQNRDGLLIVEHQTDGDFYDPIGFYHVYDFNMFWVNIRENAQLRADTWLAKHG